MTARLPQFQSFIMAGFECTYALAENHRRLDMLSATRHDVLCEEDYQMIKAAGITTVREGLAWHQIDRGQGHYDFSRFEKMMALGQAAGIQQIWDLNHFDYPADLDPFGAEFVTRFQAYAAAAVQVLRRYISGTIYIVPLNEISFFAWIGADRGWWAPYSRGQNQGFAFKRQLVKAALAAMESIWSIDKDVRFIHVDPFMRRLATQPASRAARQHVRNFNHIIRFEAWDMIAGKTHPEVGGHPKYLDIIGVNYYIHNQEWVMSHQKNRRLKHQMMDWDSPDRISFAQMLKDIYDRYQRPMVVTETGSYGGFREQWWQRVLKEVDEALAMGLPVGGVCIYPTVDRPESAGFLLPNSGLWDFDMSDVTCQRLPHTLALEVVKNYLDHHSATAQA